MGSKEIVRPPRLVPGSRVGLLAPAGPLLERDDITRGVELCRALDWEPVLLPHAGGRHGYLAGSDAERLADLNHALRDPALDALWCLRGGYGVTRILDQVEFDALAQRPRAIIGFSDITALLLAAHHHTGLVTFHGPMARAPLTRFSREHQTRVLVRQERAGKLGRLTPPADVLVPRSPRIVPIRSGKAEGPLLGGNLTLIQCLIGSRHLPDFDGAILFIEDVGEELYRIDRMLAHLRMAGLLDKVAGVAVGQFTETTRRGADGAMGFDEVLTTYLEPLGVPVAFGFPIGHVDDQWTLPIGVRARLDAGAGDLELLEAAVS
ncbi:MAG TPA: LD-carboxypeptidase [Gemmatimonadales bacterium]|nr:LD-carboxypeptidase [Gemmatimonadales bacterium]